MNVDQAASILLGHRPRRPWRRDETFRVSRVGSVASASNCLTELLVANPPEWDFMNSAFHYPTVEDAQAAARRAGAEDAEVHATLLHPLLFDGERMDKIHVRLAHPAAGALRPGPAADGVESLGLDVVALAHPSSDHTGGQPLEHISFGCAPLSCNGLGTDFPVNTWCLLDHWEDAVKAARRFAIEEPEPGPFVIVEVQRVIRRPQGSARDDRLV